MKRREEEKTNSGIVTKDSMNAKNEKDDERKCVICVGTAAI